MTKGDWLDLSVLERKKYNCLSEVMELSRQMGEALDRNDDVSVRMLLALRQDPILQLEELKQAIARKRDGLEPEEQDRLSALAAGASPKGESEESYTKQAGSARRLLERVVELDRRLSIRLGGKNSFYSKTETKP
ncbi:hypothetical protein D1646_07980 [Pseudoflavonifractor sp. 60]|uniref:hypothetical protein n=1 Tax=Pseudoflavonifractor sp. 60 TaxID=2304576 RepID=UPI001369DFF8|nr:hypothetical protein [Pseudoflavonifractor sp. 60]NBI66755.1 hypothetical protein [Pseudoflavonifractor sp. 60]